MMADDDKPAESGIYTTYQSVIQSRPTDWDFYGQSPYQIRVVCPSAPICIFNKVVLHGYSLTGKPFLLQLTFVMDDGSYFGGVINLQPKEGEYSLLIKDLKKVKTVILPFFYPTFLPYYFNDNNDGLLDIKKAAVKNSHGPQGSYNAKLRLLKLNKNY